ncbi:hypothetical protein [Ensifer sp. 2TAB8]|uniref:hypothetical protein n=3 Tax=unclassified Ensifer TaxID=2633371 RepID=UPI003F9363CC
MRRRSFLQVGILAATDRGAAIDHGQCPEEKERWYESTGRSLDVVDEVPSRGWAVANYHPVLAPPFIRTAGYTMPGDFGGALYTQVDVVPSHNGFFQISLADGVTTAYYQLSELGVTPEMFGAKGDGITDDLAAFQSAVAFSRRLYLVRGGVNYRLHGQLDLPRFQSIIGFGMANSDSNVTTGAPKLIFSGTGTHCIGTNNSDGLSTHSKIGGFVLRDTSGGGYRYLMNFRQCIEMTFEDIKLETTHTGTAGFHGYKDNLSDVSWSNRMSNVKVRLPDENTEHTLDVNWSDSTVLDCQFTGGYGAIDRGVEVRYIGCQFERSQTLGMTVVKSAITKRSCFIGCTFDGNSYVGLRFDTFMDESTTYHVESSVVGCTFRTLDPNSGTPGKCDIEFVNERAGTVYQMPVISGNTHQGGAVARFEYFGAGSWSGGKFLGNSSRDFNEQNFGIEDDALYVEPTGIKVPRGMVAARGERTVYGQEKVSGFFGNRNSGAAGVALGHDGADAFVAATCTKGKAKQALAFKVGGVTIARFTPDGDFFQLITDMFMSLGTGTEKFLNVFSRNFRPGPSASSPIWTSGVGSPEGLLSAPVGSLYTRLDGGANTTLYVKERGSRNTGWVAK